MAGALPCFVGLASPGVSATARVLPDVSPAGHCVTMGSLGPGLTLACCLLLTFACGPVLGRMSPGQQEHPQQEGTKEPLLDHTER